MTRGKHRRRATDAPNSQDKLAQVLAAWAALDESGRAQCLAVLLRSLLASPAMQDEMQFWLVTLQNRAAALVADLVATPAD